MSPLIHVIVPSHNCSEFLAQCLFSLSEQEFDDGFRVVVIDDASTEERHNIVMREWCEPRGWKTITNTTNMAAPHTIKQGIEASEASPDDVIVLLDGDDKLGSTALRIIRDMYLRAPETLLTYGNYYPEPAPTDLSIHTLASDYPTLVRRSREFRAHNISRYNHGITFRRKLWDALDDADLQDDQGKWFRAGYDVVLMMPMLEMTAPDRYLFCDDQYYIYNSANPLSESGAKPRDVDRVHSIVRSRPKKGPFTE